MKKILVLGGARAQLNLIRIAKEMGIYTVVVGTAGNYPGYKIADEYKPVDIFDKKGVLKIARELEINGISMVCSDFGLSTVGYVCDKMGLSGISEYSAEVSSNKMRMKELFEKADVKTAKYNIIKNDKDAIKASNDLAFPIIVKAVDLQGSRGIYICEDPQSLMLNYKKSIAESRVDYCLAEEFLIGEEFGAQAFVYNGEVLFVLPHGDKTIAINSSQVPMYHYIPYMEGNVELNRKVDRICRKAIKALALDNCAVNIDLILKDGEPYVIEIAGRAGANCLPEMVSAKYGINYYKMVVLCAMGDDPKGYFDSRNEIENAVMTKMIFSRNNGVIENVVNCPAEIQLFVKTGDFIHEFTNSRDYIGQVICVDSNICNCEQRISALESQIQLKLKKVIC